MMPDLKLGKLRDRTPVKLTIGIAPELSEALAAYAELYLATYGEAEPVQALVPAMLERFLESDRAFILHRRKGTRS
jgi:hypothetical protein